MNSIKPKNIDEYISALPEDIQVIMQKIRATIKAVTPEAEETISYSMPAFKQNGILVWFAAFKNHIGFFPKTKAIEVFKEELSPYKLSKGTIQFPLDKPIPYELIEKIVKFRLEENEAVIMYKKRKN